MNKLNSNEQRDSCDLADAQANVLKSTSKSRVSSYLTTKTKPRNSDRSKGSAVDLIPDEELNKFSIHNRVLKSPFLLKIIESRDLLMGILAVILLFASIILFAAVQVSQPVGYNRLIPDKFYTDYYLKRKTEHQRCFLAYILTMMGFMVTFYLSVRWKREIDEKIRVARLRKRELFQFKS